MNTHIVPSQNDYKDKIFTAARLRKRIDWTCPKCALPGDRVFFYVATDGLIACGKVKSDPARSDYWNRRYAADISDIRLLDTYVSIATLRMGMPEFRWARYPRSYVTLSEEQATELDNLIESAESVYLDVEIDGGEYIEGAVKAVQINAYERSASARKAAIKAHGQVCAVCSFDFGTRYGPSMEGFIHVHHVRPLNEIDASYRVNPKKDLVPVCPNCHAVIHSQRKALSIAKVRAMYRRT